MVAHQDAWEFGQLLEIFKNLEPMVSLEIGTYEGGTLMQFVKSSPQGARVGSLDTIEPKAWPNVPGVLTTYFRGSSHDPEIYAEVVRRLPSIDFLFIDGDHTYEGVRQDYEMYSPLVRSGGVVAFHDIVKKDDNCGVPRFWKEVAGERREEFVSPDSSMGIGVVFVP